MLSKKVLGATAGAEKLYVEDVASVYLYTGNGSTQTITNNVDLSGEGGLVWIKSRSAATDHQLFDTARGATKELISNSTAAEATDSDTLTAFNADGFSLGADSNTNTNAATYASFTFRKAPKFFDVVTYTGNGANRTIAHNLGSVPGSIWVKRTDTTGAWQCYHRSLANTEYLVLNTTAAKATGTDRWNSTTPTSTVFSLGTDSTVNANGGTYVAYLFAHDAGGFGAAGTDNVISCGSFAGGSSVDVNLGYEPQYVMFKRTNGDAGPWYISDIMRGASNTRDLLLQAHVSDAELDIGAAAIIPTASGFRFIGSNFGYTSGSDTIIYMAIRRPMKPPTSGTQVFSVATRTGTGSSVLVDAGFPSDLIITANRDRSSESNTPFASRLTGFNVGAVRYLSSNLTDAEATGTGSGFYEPIGQTKINTYNAAFNASGERYLHYFMRRATGFFDVVCYTGTGTTQTLTHNLGVVPELIISKKRNGSSNWITAFDFTSTNMRQAYVNLTNSAPSLTYGDWGLYTTRPTSTSLTMFGDTIFTEAGTTSVSYLFATLAGVSKVGSYTGTGSAQTINCGFTAGARFVMIKRTDDTGDWYIYDTARGIVSGNDPYLLLNSTAAEVTNTDYIDPANSGFEISSTAPAAINANGGSFIFLAIA